LEDVEKQLSEEKASNRELKQELISTRKELEDSRVKIASLKEELDKTKEEKMKLEETLAAKSQLVIFYE
jgi:chromosome segregation ATPase